MRNHKSLNTLSDLGRVTTRTRGSAGVIAELGQPLKRF